MTNPMPQQIYRHFKGMLYQIISLAEHSETGEMLVIYQALYGEFKIYARPLSMFMEKVDKEKYPNVSQEYRFELQGSIGGADFTSAGAEASQSPAWPKLTASAQPEAAQMTQPEMEVAVTAKAPVQSGEEPAEEYTLDPLVLEFLDAESYEERLNILTALHHRITDDMITTMAVAVDVEIEDGDIEQRYDELRRSLLLYDKFECNRLR